MEFLPYGQVDHYGHPHRRADNDYPPSIDLSPYSTRPGDAAYGSPYRSPPPSYANNTYDYDQPPSGVYHSSHTPFEDYQTYAPPPPPPRAPSSYDDKEENPHLKPHDMPSFIEGQYYNKPNNTNNLNNYVSGVVKPVEHELGLLASKPSHRIFCKAGGERFAVAIRDGEVVLTRPNPNDPTQHWYKDERHSIKVKDEERRPSFALVNKATGQAIKHSVAGYPVQVIPYKPDVFDVSILWTESKDLGYGFRTIRTVNNISLVMDAFHGDKDHGGVHDGTIVALYKCWKGDNQNQQWKILPY